MLNFRYFQKALFFLIFISGALFFPVLVPAEDEGGSGGGDDAVPISSEPPAAPQKDAPASDNTLGSLAAQPVLGEDSILEEKISWNSKGILDLLRRFGIALGIVAGQALLIWIMWRFFDRFKIKLAAWGRRKLKPLTIKNLNILSTGQMVNILLFGLRIVKYVITAFQLFLTIPIVFSLFPLTENLASTLFGYILTPLKNIFINAVKYIPSLFTIIIILLITRYVVKAMKFFATQIERERLVVPGFYSDWAQPTFNILRILLYAFTIAMVYPYLPGSGSPIFQGVTVFAGLIFSLGSTSAIGNLIAGVVITYMRPFKVGDRIQIQETTGFVVEKSLMVVRIRTHKNEYVTFPNMMILGSKITNYHTSSAAENDGLILHAEITMGYAIPWATVHEILITAALKTSHVLDTPKPFVLQTALDDYYARYQINAYTKKVERVPAIYSELYQNLQDGFAAANIDLTAPSYQVRIMAETPVKLPYNEPANILPRDKMSAEFGHT
jgi:small-conductance mechanosensitive channel